jgi:hypothetical protein
MVPPGRIELPTSALPSKFNGLHENSHVVFLIDLYAGFVNPAFRSVPRISRGLSPGAYDAVTDDNGRDHALTVRLWNPILAGGA